jgi:two-component system phosphate regulon response regulator OmpR
MAGGARQTGAAMNSESAQPHILIVDDDRRIRELLKSFLSEHGFRVSAAGSASEAREFMRGLEFDLLVLDIMMPGESGIALTQSLRGAKAGVPILLLSALAETEDRIKGLMSGSDDYLPKPFEPRELLLRIQNILRRGQTATRNEEVKFGAFTFHMGRGELRHGDEPVKLTTRERDLLKLLALRSGMAVARNELAKPGSDESARSVDVQINRLRQKIEDDPSHPIHLQTVRGLGYTLYLD